MTGRAVVRRPVSVRWVPSNLRTWDNRPLYYYRPNEGFSACATDSRQLLTQTNGSVRAFPGSDLSKPLI